MKRRLVAIRRRPPAHDAARSAEPCRRVAPRPARATPGRHDRDDRPLILAPTGDQSGVERITSWREFDDAVSAAGGLGGNASRVPASLASRGLARADYPNVPSLARLGEGYARLERHLIRNFRKYAHREQPGPTVWDWLSLAQHHGLPTRLLDWTFSPFVAAHFATASHPNEEAVVWAVDCEAAHELLPRSLKSELEDE